MPTYDYVCASCKYKWEHDSSIKDPPLTSCPKCGSESAKRLISGGTGFLLQGSGWAREGYSNAEK